jgi:hypothetical protein
MAAASKEFVSARGIFIRILETPPEEREAALNTLLQKVDVKERPVLLPQVKEFEKQQEAIRKQVGECLAEIRGNFPNVKGLMTFGTTPVGDESRHDIDLLVFCVDVMQGDCELKFEQLFRKHLKVDPHVTAILLPNPERRPDLFMETMRGIAVFKTLFSAAPPERWKQTSEFRLHPWNYTGDEKLGRHIKEALEKLEPEITAAQKRGFSTMPPAT